MNSISSSSSSATTALVPASTAHNSSGAIRLHQLPDDTVIHILPFLATSSASWHARGSADLARLSRVNKSLNTHIKRHEFKLSRFLANPIPDADPERAGFAALVRTLDLYGMGISNAQARCAKVIQALPNVQDLACDNSLEAALMVELQQITRLRVTDSTFSNLIALAQQEGEKKKQTLSFLDHLTWLRLDHLPPQIEDNLVPHLLPHLHTLEIDAESDNIESLHHFSHIQQLTIQVRRFGDYIVTLTPEALSRMLQLREVSIFRVISLSDDYEHIMDLCNASRRLPHRPRLILKSCSAWQSDRYRPFPENFLEEFHDILTIEHLIIQSPDFKLHGRKLLQRTKSFVFLNTLPTPAQIAALVLYNQPLRVFINSSDRTPTSSHATKLAAADLKKKRPDFTVSYFEISTRWAKEITPEEASTL